MKTYHVTLMGFFNNIVFTHITEAQDKTHALRIASIVFNGPHTKGIVKEV